MSSRFPQNVDNFVDIACLELWGHSKTLTCCSGAWRYKGWKTLVYRDLYLAYRSIRNMEHPINIFYFGLYTDFKFNFCKSAISVHIFWYLLYISYVCTTENYPYCATGSCTIQLNRLMYKVSTRPILAYYLLILIKSAFFKHKLL